jgi:cytochrome c oxidase subunit II
MSQPFRKWSCTVAAAAALLGAAPPARAGEARVVDIAAKRFEFSPRELVLKRGEKVTLRLRTGDVTHGFYQKALGIDTTIEPGKTTEVTLTPEKAGRFLTICDHFCGSGHGGMSMTIVVEEPGAKEAAR